MGPPASARSRRRREATIVDVARLSGVSKSTVSNVVHDSAPVAEQTRLKVQAAIERLNYRPNALARDLKRRHTATAGVIVGDLANPFYAELTKLLESRIANAGYAAIICDTDGDRETERARIDLLLEQRIAGVLLTWFDGDDQTLRNVHRAGVPVVGVSVSDPRFDCVASNDSHGGRLAGEHLIELGHRSVAYVRSTGTEPSTNAARLRGMRDSLRRAGLDPGPVVTLDGPPGRGAVSIDELLAARDAPTAYLAGNDVTALALIDRLEAAGVSVPGGASVIGFDDIPLARHARISLTTLRQPTAELAQRGVDRLLQRVQSGTAEPRKPLHDRLLSELVKRGTTAPPRP